MGAGKSTAAREIGAALGGEAFDSDEVHAERAPLYERLAAAIVAPGPVARLAALAPSLRVLEGARGARLLWASAASGEYPVLIGDGLLGHRAAELLARWPLERERSRAFC